jgi:putative DNA primase/helicase
VFHMSALPHWVREPPDDEDGWAPVEPEAPKPQPRKHYTRTDDGNALKLIDTHHHHVRYCPEAASWLHWTGYRWEWDTAGNIHEHARQIARDLPIRSGDEGKTDRAHQKKSLSNNGLKGMVSVARTDPRTIVTPSQLDARPYELNTPKGIVNLRTGKLMPPNPAALHSRTTPVAPHSGPAPRWEKFLSDTFAGQPEMTIYIQRLLGLSIIGEHLEQILPFPFGSGANGKSTLMDVVQGVIGSGRDGYSIPAPSELLLTSSQQGHPTELARLSGARLVVASELEDGQRFAESRIKQLTGGDRIAARFMGKDFFDFVPTHTIWLHANHQPKVSTGGPALWRRMRLLPFVHVVPESERVVGLEHQLIAQEGAQILAWIIQGCVDYLNDGLAEPDSVKQATKAYEMDQDTVARFVEECCALGARTAQGFSIRVPELRSEYEQWCKQEGESPVSSKALTMALTNRYDVGSERSMSSRYYSGIRLTDVSSDVSSEPPPDEQFEPDWGQK